MNRARRRRFGRDTATVVQPGHARSKLALTAVIGITSALAGGCGGRPGDIALIKHALLRTRTAALGYESAHVSAVDGCRRIGKSTHGHSIYFCAVELNDSTVPRLICAAVVGSRVLTADEEKAGMGCLHNERQTYAPLRRPLERWTDLTFKCDDVDSEGHDIGPAILSNATSARDYDNRYRTERQARALARRLHLRFGVDC